MDLVKFDSVDVMDVDVVVTMKVRELLALYAILGETNISEISQNIKENAPMLENSTGFDFYNIVDKIRNNSLAIQIFDEMSSIIDDIGNELK